MTRPRRWAAVVSALAGLIAAGAWAVPARADQDSLRTLLPAGGDAKGWVSAGDPQEFVGEDLYTYIDGGAEIYQEYGFRRVVIQDYKNAPGKSVSLEIFEMETPEAAFGIFTFKRSGKGKSVPLGSAGEVEDYYLNFWKGRFLVTLTGFDDTGETIEGLLAVARSVDAKIKETAEPPGLLAALPGEGLRPGSVKYLKGLLGLNNVYPFYTARGLSFVSAVKGDYENDATLLVLDYGTTEALNEAGDKLGHDLMGSERFKNLAGNDLEIDTLVLVDGKGRHLIFKDSRMCLYVGIGPDLKAVGDIVRRATR